MSTRPKSPSSQLHKGCRRSRSSRDQAAATTVLSERDFRVLGFGHMSLCWRLTPYYTPAMRISGAERTRSTIHTPLKIEYASSTQYLELSLSL